MLENLGAIDWASLTDAYGPATNIPKWLRDLTSDDPEDWVAAIDGLYWGICHQQCTVSEATPRAVPFLLELLGSREVRCRARILELLGDIARATSDLADEDEFDSDDDERHTEAFQEMLAAGLEWVHQSRQAVWRGLDAYLELLGDFDPRLRVSVPYTLGLLVRHAGGEMPDEVRRADPFATISRALALQLDEEPNELVRASLVFGLGAVAPVHPENVALLRSLVAPASSPQVRVAAAMCLSEVDAEFPEEAVRVLTDALEHFPETDHLFDSDRPGIEDKHHPLAKSYREMGRPLGKDSGTGFDPADLNADEDFRFPWLEGWPRFSYIECLCRVGADRTGQVLPALLTALRAENTFTVGKVSAPILRFVFQGTELPEGATEADLSPPQREVLRAIYDNPLLWATNSGMVGIEFDEAGLPRSRDGWERLLGIEPRPLTESEAERVLDLLVRDSLNVADDVPIAPGHRQRLKSLYLRAIGGDEFPPQLAGFPMLETLDFGESKLTDRGLALLPELPHLRDLQLCGTPVSDAGLAHLSALSSLEVLNLSRTGVTDAGLDFLKGFKRLKSVGLYMTPVVTDEAIEDFVRALPGCKVER